MYWSAGLAALVPPAETTVTSTAPSAPPGVYAVIDESSFTKNGAATPPKSTSYASVNPEPVIVTTSPPTSGPELGLTPSTTGAGTGV